MAAAITHVVGSGLVAGTGALYQLWHPLMRRGVAKRGAVQASSAEEALRKIKERRLELARCWPVADRADIVSPDCLAIHPDVIAAEKEWHAGSQMIKPDDGMGTEFVEGLYSPPRPGERDASRCGINNHRPVLRAPSGAADWSRRAVGELVTCLASNFLFPGMLARIVVRVDKECAGAALREHLRARVAEWARAHHTSFPYEFVLLQAFDCGDTEPGLAGWHLPSDFGWERETA